MSFGAHFGPSHENPVRNVLQKLVLHAVEVLDDCSLVEVLLNLLLCRDACLKQRVDQILEHLPEEEEVVALGDDEVHRQELVRRSLFVKEPLETCLVLECDRLVNVEHLEHELFDVFDSHDLECLVEQLYQVSRRTRKVVPVPIDLNFVLHCQARALALPANVRVPSTFLFQDVHDDLDQRAVNLDRVRVAQGDEAVIECVVAARILI